MARTRKQPSGRLITVIKILTVFGFSGLVIGVFIFAESHLRGYAEQSGPLVFDDLPDWVGQTLLSKAYNRVGGTEFILNEHAARAIGESLASMEWLDQIQVRVGRDGIHVRAQWRKPLLVIKHGTSQFYVDADGVVLDSLPLNLPLVKLQGVRIKTKPRSGMRLTDPDLAAAVELIALLDQMDQKITPDKPLLGEIEDIDLSNFQGRRRRNDPHIVFTVKDGTRLVWGAQIGQWGKYMELSDDKKLARLYTYYQECGSTLMGGSKSINLRDSLYEVPTPIQKH